MAEENKLSKNSFAENFAKLLTDKFFDKKDELKDFLYSINTFVYFIFVFVIGFVSIF